VVKQAFADAGVADQCQMVVGPGGHGFDPDLVWPVIMEVNK